jgi:HAD superfamily hydrolase (TIGR01509 family)
VTPVNGELVRPRVLFLDAGNTVVFLDHGAVARAAQNAHVHVTGARLCKVEPEAKRRYEDALADGMSHEDGWHLYMCVLFEAAGVDVHAAQGAARAARVAHDEKNLWRLVPPGCVEALERARAAGIRCGIISNAEGQIAALLREVGIFELFDVIVDSGLEGVRKPDPEIFRSALARADVPAHEALYAGDIPKIDVEGARAAGMQAVLIDTLDHFPQYRDAPRFASVAALVDALGC